jgi:hypothetical protein
LGWDTLCTGWVCIYVLANQEEKSTYIPFQISTDKPRINMYRCFLEWIWVIGIKAG